MRPPNAQRHPAARFSALQRAENSSTSMTISRAGRGAAFQCSSASRKFLNNDARAVAELMLSFSALQRAENSSIDAIRSAVAAKRRRFSALQRAENSSTIAWLNSLIDIWKFQCSSASRKFLNAQRQRLDNRPHDVSVLFSEPKIPQPRSR